ncbi:hypothetical protein PG985_005995 [Apiospora marii]|uniref:Uncharacterized protein n=1 Tax=Apiospora marii TaxID=335849 RepID=A0ABR1S6I2_9PEZI
MPLGADAAHDVEVARSQLQVTVSIRHGGCGQGTDRASKQASSSSSSSSVLKCRSGYTHTNTLTYARRPASVSGRQRVNRKWRFIDALFTWLTWEKP